MNTYTVSKSLETRARQFMLAATLARRAPAKRAWEVSLDAARLRLLARRLDNLNTAQCNREISERERVSGIRAVNEASDIAQKYGATAYFGGDPRGVAVRIYWPDMLPPDCADAGSYTDRMLAVEID